MCSEKMRAAFEEKIKLDEGVYWCDSRRCYMRDAGGGFTVSDNTANSKLEGWQAALTQPAPPVPEGLRRYDVSSDAFSSEMDESETGAWVRFSDVRSILAPSMAEKESNDKMREALEYYANPTHWSSGDVPGHTYAYEDAGAFAREALAQQPESEPAAEVCERTGEFGSYEEVVFLADCPPGTKLYKSPQPTPQVPKPSREVFEEELRGWLGGGAEYKDKRLERRGGSYKDDAVEMSWFVYRKTNRIGPFAPSISEKRNDSEP